jgi:hypothetical protein
MAAMDRTMIATEAMLSTADAEVTIIPGCPGCGANSSAVC